MGGGMRKQPAIPMGFCRFPLPFSTNMPLLAELKKRVMLMCMPEGV